MADEAKCCSPVVQLLECWLCTVWSVTVAEKNWALSVDQCWLQALRVLMHFIDLLSIRLRYNGFTKTQKAIVDQMGSRPSDSDNNIFCVCKFGFGKCFGASCQSNH